MIRPLFALATLALFSATAADATAGPLLRHWRWSHHGPRVVFVPTYGSARYHERFAESDVSRETTIYRYSSLSPTAEMALLELQRESLYGGGESLRKRLTEIESVLGRVERELESRGESQSEALFNVAVRAMIPLLIQRLFPDAAAGDGGDSNCPEVQALLRRIELLESKCKGGKAEQPSIGGQGDHRFRASENFVGDRYADDPLDALENRIDRLGRSAREIDAATHHALQETEKLISETERQVERLKKIQADLKSRIPE